MELCVFWFLDLFLSTRRPRLYDLSVMTIQIPFLFSTGTDSESCPESTVIGVDANPGNARKALYGGAVHLWFLDRLLTVAHDSTDEQ